MFVWKENFFQKNQGMTSKSRCSTVTNNQKDVRPVDKPVTLLGKFANDKAST
jgi:hypothetical protein